MGLLRLHLLSLACFAVAGLFGIAAIVDHTWKTDRMNRAELSEWYCHHKGTRCGGPSSARIEDRWQQRQVGYEAAVIGLGGFAIVLFVSRLARR